MANAGLRRNVREVEWLLWDARVQGLGSSHAAQRGYLRREDTNFMRISLPTRTGNRSSEFCRDCSHFAGRFWRRVSWGNYLHFFPSVCCSSFLLLIVLLGYISCVLRWAGFVLFWCNVCTISGLYYQDRSFITFTKCVHNFWVIRRWPSLVSWQMYAPSTEKLVFQTGPIKRSLIYFSLRGFLRYGSSTEKFRILRMLVCFWLFAFVTIFTGSGSFAFDEFVGRGKQIFGGVASSRKRRSCWRWYRRLSLPGWLNFSLKWFDTILVLPWKE